MPALRCGSCNRFRPVEEFEVYDVELESVSITDGEVYGTLRATISVQCPECGEEIGTMEAMDVEVKLGSAKEIVQA